VDRCRLIESWLLESSDAFVVEFRSGGLVDHNFGRSTDLVDRHCKHVRAYWPAGRGLADVLLLGFDVSTKPLLVDTEETPVGLCFVHGNHDGLVAAEKVTLHEPMHVLSLDLDQ
jgi:hypothetical protein